MRLSAKHFLQHAILPICRNDTKIIPLLPDCFDP
jgi:hypothetical protein